MPCGLINTTTTFASGLPFESFTCPVIATVVCGGLFSFSTGEVASVELPAGSGVDSGVPVAAGSEVGEAEGADDAGVGSGVAAVDSPGVGSGVVAAGASTEGDGAGTVAESAGGAGDAGATGTSGVDAGVLSGDEVGCTVSLDLSGAGVGAIADIPEPGPIRSLSPSSEPLTLR